MNETFQASASRIRCIARIKPISSQTPGGDDDVEAVIQEGNVLKLDGKFSTKVFHLDRVFSANASQSSIFEEIGPFLDDSIDRGYNASILFYGQTGR